MIAPLAPIHISTKKTGFDQQGRRQRRGQRRDDLRKSPAAHLSGQQPGHDNQTGAGKLGQQSNGMQRLAE